eukprot:14355428-Alexandrium_andersonii.AAC.1
MLSGFRALGLQLGLQGLSRFRCSMVSWVELLRASLFSYVSGLMAFGAQWWRRIGNLRLQSLWALRLSCCAELGPVVAATGASRL